ncbi:MAG: Helix-turn-helix domain protein [Bacteroidetes bacterium ADurb.Bin123]|nr:MAG: Helix-turn-helix domain protein [Bacteroidetes bacterium ADurb.Bin123]
MQTFLNIFMEKFEINKRIKQLINYLNFNQREFAKEIGVSSSRMSNIITFRNRPDSEMLQLILFRFRNVNADWLLTGTGNIEEINNRKIVEINAEFEKILKLLKEKDLQIINLAIEKGVLQEQVRILKKQLGYSNSNIAAES